MERLQYDEFDILLERSSQGFSARVVEAPTGPTTPVPFVPPGTPEGLRLLVLTLRAVRGVRGLQEDATPEAERYGKALFAALFTGDVLHAYRGSLYVAGQQGHGLRVRLHFSDSQDLANIPWELLYDGDRHRFPCQFSKYPIVRYVDVPEPVIPLALDGPLRMLVVVSGPRDFPELDVEKEMLRVTSAVSPLEKSGRLQMDRLPIPTPEATHEALLKGGYHVFHFMGHGGLDRQTGDGVLAFTGPDGLSRLVNGQLLRVFLSNSPIQLAVLNACDGARISEVDPYAGTALSLVEQGIPAVVAMQFEITDQASIAFSSTLYESITSGAPVDLAVTLARQAILATSHTEWATPVLYMRSRDGQLFDIPEAPPAPPLAAPAELTAAIVEQGRVSLRWSTSPAAREWEVYRDAALVGTVKTPSLEDESAEPGAHVYSVVSLADQGRRSVSSDPCEIVVPTKEPPEPPTPVITGRERKGRTVLLRWESASEEGEVDHWEVMRDATMVAETTQPSASDTVPGRGRYTYTVVAVSPDGRRSTPSDASEVVVPGRVALWSGAGGAAVITAGVVLALTTWNPNGSGGDGATSRPPGTSVITSPLVALPASAALPKTQMLVPVDVGSGYAIYLADTTKKSPVRKLTHSDEDGSGASDRTPALSPDRRTVAYVHRDAKGFQSLRVMGAEDGRGARELFDPVPPECAGGALRPAFDPSDPQRIVVTCQDKEGRFGLYLISVAGEVLRTYQTGYAKMDDPAFSRDGRRIAYWASSDLKRDGGEIFTIAADGKSPPTRLTTAATAAQDADPTWSPDTDEIAFRRRVAGSQSGDLDIYVMAPDGSGLRRLTSGRAIDQDPSWSPGGDQLSFKSNRTDAEGTSTRKESRTWVMSAAGDNLSLLWSEGQSGIHSASAWSNR